ncbi:hypothetical protein GCM10027345_33330 [Hymenobacter daeguensis]
MDAYPQIREEWLFFGRGGMLKDAYNPQYLKAHIMGARFHIEDSIISYNLKEIDRALTLFRNSSDYLKNLEPAMKAVENGLYPDFDKAEVEDYYSVLRDLDEQIAAAEEMKEEYLNSKHQREQEGQAPANRISTCLKGFIEVRTIKGQAHLIAIAAISHIYPYDEQGTKTTIELATMRDSSNIIIDSLLPYDRIKDLIAAAS